MDGRKQMDADNLIMVARTVQTDCQVCDTAWVSWHVVFAIYAKVVCGLSFRSAAFQCGEKGGASFGPGAAADGSKFPLSRWSQGHIEPPNSEGEAGFAFFCTVDRSFGVALQPFE